MEEAVVVSYSRTALAKSFRGGFNATHGAKLAGEAIKTAVDRAGIDPAIIDDVIMGCGFPEGATGLNIARQGALAAGLSQDVSGFTVNRYCASGLQSLVLAAQRIRAGEAEVFVAGGVESISCVQNHINSHMLEDSTLKSNIPSLYWSMLQTAECVAQRYGIGRERQDEYGVRSQQLASSAQERGIFKEEIVPVATTMNILDPNTKQPVGTREVVVAADEGVRGDTTFAGVQSIRPALDGGVIAAGNASQLSDGAAAAVVMSATLAERLGLEPIGIFRGFAVAGCSPDEMGIGPVFSIPKLLARAKLRIEDIDLWELNEAFAVQVLYCVEKLGIPMDRLNVNGGAIALGHPYGVSGTRLVGSGLLEARRRKGRYLVATMCVAGGMGAAGLFETL
jgi:acetyl-CoA C-acetyltransferase